MSAPPLHSSVETLWRGLHEQLEAFVRRRTGSQEEAEDIVGDVFLRIQVALGKEPRIERLDAWVYRIARNAIIDRYRRRRTTEALGDASAPAEDEEVEGLREALARCLAPFVERLPEPYAEAVRWADVEGLTQADAARRAGISVSGMKSRVQRGRRQLRELVDACCRFELDSRGKVVGFEARGCGC